MGRENEPGSKVVEMRLIFDEEDEEIKDVTISGVDGEEY